ncbi:ABC transporter ATP-binding protein [Rheinheimera fenheensis]|uniref:ABC transporter ATP-binding protein n=1 Tax=Rheinheimera fenheensis TaxID=3152295 RepID=UPI00325D4FB2
MLKVSGLSLQLGSQVVLQDITFSLPQQGILGVIGPNGAGKSSLLKLISRALPPTSGQILLRQRSLNQYTNQQLARTLAVVSQHPPPLFALSVFQVAAMGLLPHKSWFETSNSSDRASVSRALNKVGLGNKADALIDTLSGGELQRLYIARALVQQPALLLLDEPTNHLDVQYQHQVLQLLRELNIPVLVCIHDLNLAALYCDNLLLLHNGQQVSFGTPEQVLQHQQLQQVFALACQVSRHPALDKLQITFLPPGAV